MNAMIRSRTPLKQAALSNFRRRCATTTSATETAKAHTKGTRFVEEAVANPSNPRVFPRAAVWAGSAGLIGFFAYRFFRTADVEASERTNIIRERVPPASNEVVKTVSENVPKLVHGEEYKQLKHEGLGVDHEQWKKDKMNQS